MRPLRVLLSRLLDTVIGGRRDRELDAELQLHLDLLAEDLIARGLPPDAARLEARRQFGGVDQAKARYRDARGFPSLDGLLQDLRFAARTFARDRGFTATAVIVLALGIGVNNMMFTILNAHTIRGLPLPESDRVLSVGTIDTNGIVRGVSWPDFEDLRRAVAAARLVAFTASPAALGEDDRAPDRVNRVHMTADALSVLGVRPFLGRDLTVEDGMRGAQSVAILSERVWRRRYEADPAIVGRQVLVDGTVTIVVGVLSSMSGFPATADLFQPIGQLSGADSAPRTLRNLNVAGRVLPAADVAAARAEIETATLTLAAQHPETNSGIRARVMMINEQYLGRLTDPAWLAFMAVGCLVALISCANVANLLLGRALTRAREMALRTSLGADRGRIVRQLLVESAALATTGALAGLAVGLAGVRLFRGGFPDDALPYWMAYSVDGRVLAALALVAMAMTFGFGLLPALDASRFEPQVILRQGGPTVSRIRTNSRWTSGLLVAEFALAFVMLANLALSWRLQAAAPATDAALNAEDVMTATVSLPAGRYPDPSARLAFMRRLEQRLEAIPGARAVALTSALPARPVPERPLAARSAPDREPTAVRQVFVSADYFAALGVPLSSGRAIESQESEASLARVVVNEPLARLLFGSSAPLDERVRFAEPGPGSAPWLTVVGVAPLIRQNTKSDAIAYMPIAASPPATFSVLLSGSAPPELAASQMRQAVTEIDRHLPLYNMASLHEATRQADAMGRASSRLLAALTLIAIGLGGAGLYAVLARSVVSRRREFGIRLALGATPGRIRRIVMTQAAGYVLAGSLFGCLAVLAWDAAFAPSVRSQAELPGAWLADPAVLAGIAVTVLPFALLASIAPIRRTLDINPAQVLGDH